MSPLQIAHYTLVISASIYIAALAAGLAGLIDPLAHMVLGSYAAIALGIAAGAYVVAQIVGVFQRWRKRPPSSQWRH